MPDDNRKTASAVVVAKAVRLITDTSATRYNFILQQSACRSKHYFVARDNSRLISC